MFARYFHWVLVCLFAAVNCYSQNVIESEAGIVLNATTAEVELIVENQSDDFDGVIELELLDAENVVRAAASQNARLKKGKEKYTLMLLLGDFMQKEADEIAWFRLRYKVGNAAGIFSLSRLIRDNFQLRIVAANNLLTGMTHRSRIQAINPFTNAPVPGVRINATMTLELKGESDDEMRLAAESETDGEGNAYVNFQIPTEAKLDGDGELKITGRKNGIVREASEELSAASNDFSFLIMTDKPIYQPEQNLKIRGILLKGGEGKTVAAGVEVEFRIEDEDQTVLFREKVKTSEFGVAAVSWQIPENAKLGTYSIRVRDEGDEQIGYQSVKISRYDLPNFVVNAKAAKSYYLPGENEAEIEVRADYLFGKPVTKAKVRVVQESNREWDWKQQKYNVNEGDSRSGEVDSEGRFTAKFDLSKEHENLEDNEGQKFKDLNFAAYVTDITTNKTEQRRFDVRLTREAIHVYYIGNTWDNSSKLPVTAYVSTFYADGSPAACDVEIKGSEEVEDKFRTFARLKTNEYGAGKLEFERPDYEDDDADVDLVITAKDKTGRKGTNKNDIGFDDDDVLKVKTDKAIYKPGDSVKVRIESTIAAGQIFIDVVRGWSVVDSYSTKLESGKAEIKIPYQKQFQGELKIAAYMDEPDEDDDLLRTARGIIFPSPQNLRIDTNFDKASYKPAEEARVSFSLVDTIGSAVEGALGVVIFDRAVEERARTDSEFGGMFRDFYGWLGYGESFGGINIKDLNDLDLSKQITDEMQLVGEIILHDSYYYPNSFRNRNHDLDAKSVYSAYFKKQFEPIEQALKKHYETRAFDHPHDDASLRRILSESGINFDALNDPWEQKYFAKFEINKSQRVVSILTSGADEAFGTKDDFSVSTQSFTYFTTTGNTIDKAVNTYYARTSRIIRDEKTLLSELGISELVDVFGHPYRIFFETKGRHFVIRIRSVGKDGVYSPYNYYDDFDIWTSRIDYFEQEEKKLNEILQASKTVPLDENEFRRVLRCGGVDFSEIRDGYDRPLYIVTQKLSRFTDKVIVENVSKYGETKMTERQTITPVTQEVIQFTLRGSGEDGKQGTSDDATISQFIFVLSEQSKDEANPKPVMKKISYKRSTGSISGVITDANGAFIPDATVTATNEASSQSSSATANDEGSYLIGNLAAGRYTVKAEAAAFRARVLTGVVVAAGKTNNIDMTLEAGAVSETVEVSAGAETLDTTNSQLSVRMVENLPKGTQFSSLLKTAPGFQADGASGSENVFVIDGKQFVKDKTGKLVPLDEKSTPRLREYFPETLVWQPELITDRNGKAELKFKMADNITTWKLYTIASTKNGKIGVTDKEINVFQPFFVDLEPPKFLTEGDEIYLPTQVRNYTEKKQKVDVTMARADWFSFIDLDKKQIDVASNGSQNAVFGFKAITPIKDGKQRVTAITETDSDAIEKPVTVRPNGQEIVRTDSKLSRGRVTFDLTFPENALPRTQKAELKIYPNLFSHVSESVEGLLQRPYGCGEQTISSTYPNLMILKFVRADSILAKKARKFLQKGYERLLGYQVADGGFTYWGGKDSSDVALTAYALRFLHDAKSQIEVDDAVINRAQEWLIKQQRADGSWTKRYYYETADDAKRTTLFTAYVARILANKKSEPGAVATGFVSSGESVKRALQFLSSKTAEIYEPYALSLYGLALLDSGDKESAREIANRLEKMAIAEGDAVYWKLETNTPFYGWGTAGRIETTALVTQLLIGISKTDRQPQTESLIAKSTLFLLKNKDRYGVWYSTQTTINVLDAFLASLGGDNIQTPHNLDVYINGERIEKIEVDPERIEPVTMELADKLLGANSIEIRSTSYGPLMTQLVASHYIDWKDADVSQRNVNQSRAIRLDYKCDKTDAVIMQEIICAVEAERIGFKGYGMLLAEIGTPPGADISRESLEAAIAADRSLSRYDILPDRIILYMWSKSGGTRFNFKFKPRYGINAQTPASVVYDYYNPEAQAITNPLRFTVR